MEKVEDSSKANYRDFQTALDAAMMKRDDQIVKIEKASNNSINRLQKWFMERMNGLELNKDLQGIAHQPRSVSNDIIKTEDN